MSSVATTSARSDALRLEHTTAKKKKAENGENDKLTCTTLLVGMTTIINLPKFVVVESS